MSQLPNDAYWVEEGRFMAGPYPGAPRDEDAIRSLTDLTDAGVTHFIDLTFPKGVDSDMLEPYDHLLERLPGEIEPGYNRRSIKDLGVPTTRQMNEILATIETLTADGETVYVHCWGGVGRTGTVVACHLINSGMSAEDALDRLPELRAGLIRGNRPSPENPTQEQFVKSWKPGQR